MCVGPLKSHPASPPPQPTLTPAPPPAASMSGEAGLQLEGSTVGSVGAGYSGLRLGAGDLRLGGKAFANPAASLNPSLAKAPVGSPTGGFGAFIQSVLPKLLGTPKAAAPKPTTAASYFNAPGLRLG